MGAHKGQATTPYFSTWTHCRLVRMNRPTTCNTSLRPLRTTWKRWQKEAKKKNGEYQLKNTSAAEKKAGAGMLLETPNRFMILGVESDGEENLFHPKA